MLKFIALIAVICSSAVASADIFNVGSTFAGIRDYREVMPGVLYRGGANNGQNPLNPTQIRALCEQGVGSSFYLYRKNFGGAQTYTCQQGQLRYEFSDWQGPGRARIHKAIYDAIKSTHKPVFIHCWYGIHATGAVAATALMQFCDMPAPTAVQYWKIGIAPKLQYQKVIDDILRFQPNPALRLTDEEKARFCPRF
jgi:hypothetical protein